MAEQRVTKELNIEASLDNMHLVLDTLEELLSATDCPLGLITMILISVEEAYVNVASYAYPEGELGECQLEYALEENTIIIDLYDAGVPYNPLQKEDPDITLKAEERGIGGLGIYMVKQTMDEVTYEYQEGKNHLCMKKSW